MGTLHFDKQELGNLEYSLNREMLSTNRAGGYMSTTIICCNTRKYHGLMACPVDELGDENFVLLSSLDETVIQHDQSFNLAIHKFPVSYEPRGHKYITDFVYTPTPTITYRVGGVVLRKELLWIHSKQQILIRYTLVEASSPTKLRLRPFLAFRSVHGLSKANMFADSKSYLVIGGVKNRLYDKFPYLYLQLSTEHEFLAAPDWWYNFEYFEEEQRGYPYREDLLTTGYFEFNIEKGESVVFSCSTSEASVGQLEDDFAEELAKRTNKIDFLSCLRHSARQFIVRKAGRTEVVAGYPWFGRWGRDTFIALPGITLSQGGVERCREVIDTMTREMKNGLFPNMGSAYNSVDAPLWFFWTLQNFEQHANKNEIWNSYGKHMKDILEAYRKGINDGAIRLDDNGLVWASQHGKALTWMDAVVDGVPVTGREGYPVEINALWYNAICYTIEKATENGDEKFVDQWTPVADKIKTSFVEMFWREKEGYLSDYVGVDGANAFIRPNMVVACSLKYKMLSDEQIKEVLYTIKNHLLTPKGLRTLSPRNPLFEGRYMGTQPERDRQYHNGTVWVWLLEHYVKAQFDLHGASYIDDAVEIMAGFEEDINSYGIGSISEIYDGMPPYHQRGTISQAWSVGALLRINEMIEFHRRA